VFNTPRPRTTSAAGRITSLYSIRDYKVTRIRFDGLTYTAEGLVITPDTSYLAGSEE
jgi:hypothetical protein